MGNFKIWCLYKQKNVNKYVWKTNLEHQKTADDEGRLILMTGYGHKTDLKMVYKQDPYTRMFISQKPHKNTKIKYLKYARLLGEFDAKKNKFFFWPKEF